MLNGFVGISANTPPPPSLASRLPHHRRHHSTQNLWLHSQALSQPCNTFLSCRNAAATKSPSDLLQLQLEIGCGTIQGCPVVPFSV